jgi:uncharacterized protein (DUF1800 family)
MSKPDFLSEPRRAWEPYRPTDAEPWDLPRAAHLHRRAGFGAIWQQLQRDVQDGLEASLQRVLGGDSHRPDSRPADEYEETAAVLEASARRRPTLDRITSLWLYRLLLTPQPLAERMTLVWHSHYASSNEKVAQPLWLLGQNATQRALGRGRIGALHLAMLRDAAMLKWLDGLDSSKSRPNENLGREFLELFALGEGNYSEQDIRAAARALTGWQEFDEEEPPVRFLPDLHDDGEKTILGATGRWRDEDVVRIVCRQPAAALHIARRLYLSFISDTEEPPAGLLEPLAEAMRVEGDVDVGRGLEVLLRSQLFHSGWCRGKRVRGPVEFVVGALRTCAAFAPAPDLEELAGQLAKMGQRLFYPPTVAGWPGGMAWLRGSALLARGKFAAAFADPAALHGPRHLQAVASRNGFKEPEEVVDGFAVLLLGAPLRQAPRDDLLRLARAERDPALRCGLVVARLLSGAEAQVC